MNLFAYMYEENVNYLLKKRKKYNTFSKIINI